MLGKEISSVQFLQDKILFEFPDIAGVYIEQLPDGARMAVFIAAILLMMEEGMYLHEEHENFQNPSAIEGIAKLIARIFRDKSNLQSFFTTHSQGFLKYLLNALMDNGLENEFVLYHLILHNGELKALRFDYQGLWISFPWEKIPEGSLKLLT
ncbi:MAG: hypothetical protein ACP5QG_05510 [candidate division WOR-3 bacterium]